MSLNRLLAKLPDPPATAGGTDRSMPSPLFRKVRTGSSLSWARGSRQVLCRVKEGC
jgi:hypothetical protein